MAWLPAHSRFELEEMMAGLGGTVGAHELDFKQGFNVPGTIGGGGGLGGLDRKIRGDMEC
jgi:hypothetical protein